MQEPIGEYLEWDTQFFGVRIGRLTGHRLTRERVTEAQSWCRVNQIDCLYFLADSDDAATVTLAEANGFRLVDIRVTFERPLPKETEATPAIRAFRAEDGPRIREIARVSHRDSRFYYDPRFPESRCDALYEAWIERSAGGWADAVLVAERDGVPAGYLSCHLSGPAGSIGLVAVAPEWQGRGLGKQLIHASLEYFRRHGTTRATVVTQGRNLSSQRLYQRCGFVTQAMQLWYHRWFTTEPSA
jgi:dTDP-4-amino-4,6-dideoxy-D-galactose acyltransferase